MICENMGEPHHFATRGSGGGDEVYNLTYLCRAHHTEIHQIGRQTFVEKYPVLKTFLLHHNWSICELTGKWKHE
jgi:hypothetical protein